MLQRAFYQHHIDNIKMMDACMHLIAMLGTSVSIIMLTSIFFTNLGKTNGRCAVQHTEVTISVCGGGDGRFQCYCPLWTVDIDDTNCTSSIIGMCYRSNDTAFNAIDEHQEGNISPCLYTDCDIAFWESKETYTVAIYISIVSACAICICMSMCGIRRAIK